ncbi:dienelactone hydrolase [Deinococcus sp. KSM4-11]|uniref:alpha/beta hydrolase family protein n=1 Tax=Deinococcus sp. KSM4-11 TaxID=2568654 RepID=UPI0010A52403|nr:dienelactone hydrolase [Deinococcus sp. KSM4-11]THF88902.1 dienelactone hydrolase [Deinococcus sp. KSM4-11]
MTSSLPSESTAFFVPGDARPDAPALAPRGPHAVGVRTLHLLNPAQPDVTAELTGGELPRRDRPLTVEVWYPTPGVSGSGQETYEDVLPGALPLEVLGRAWRDAPALEGGSFPLLIVSHGYPGSRYFLTNLTENLASKGYVVAAIDHTGSTFADQGPFAVTLLHRPTDILFTLEELARLGAPGSASPLEGAVDPSHTGLIGYSMGGYGALNAAGAGFAPNLLGLVPGGALAARLTGAYTIDPRIKAVAVLAPWGGDTAVRTASIPNGGPHGFWDAEGLGALRVPTLFITGDLDDVSGFEGGVKALFEHVVNAERVLIVYQNARHNVAPNAMPSTLASGVGHDDFMRFAEPAWDTTRLNNLNQHFITAFLDGHLRGRADAAAYLDVPTPRSNDAGPNRPWPGFPPRSAVGIELHHLNGPHPTEK